MREATVCLPRENAPSEFCVLLLEFQADSLQEGCVPRTAKLRLTVRDDVDTRKGWSRVVSLLRAEGMSVSDKELYVGRPVSGAWSLLALATSQFILP